MIGAPPASPVVTPPVAAIAAAEPLDAMTVPGLVSDAVTAAAALRERLVSRRHPDAAHVHRCERQLAAVRDALSSDPGATPPVDLTRALRRVRFQCSGTLIGVGIILDLALAAAAPAN